MRMMLTLGAVLAMHAGLTIHPATAQEWIEDSFEDFNDGTLDAAGHNLYVARDGSIRTIHRYDFNTDGYIDLLFNSTHDVAAYVPATLGVVSDGRKLSGEPLAVQGSSRVVAGDLNKDGNTDLVFLRSRSGIQGARSLLSILWGAPGGGWPASRSAGGLPEPHYPTDVALPDLDADGWTDVVIFGGGSEPRTFVYWGGERGMGTFRRADLVAPADTRAAAGDFDGDGFADLACASAAKLTMLWATKSQRDLKAPEKTELVVAELPTASSMVAAQIVGSDELDLAVATGAGGVFVFMGDGTRNWAAPVKIDVPATHVAAGDLDGDGTTDLVLTNFAQTFASGGEAGAAKTADRSVVVLFGDGKAFSPDRSITLAAPNATASAIGDFDGDGRADLAVAVYQGENHFEGQSLMFFNAGDRKLTRGEGGFTTQAPLDVLAVPGAKEQPARVVFANSQAGTLNEKVPLDVYWGGSDGFDVSRRWQIPFASGSEHSAADLNADGHVDLLLTYSGHGGQRADSDDQVGTHILWGAKDGFALDRRTVLKEDLIWSTNVADLNRDGYLDIIACQESKGPNKSASVYLYYGGADGFSDERRKVIPVGSRALAGHAADLNGDGWLDIVSSDWFDHKVTILWGAESGFAIERSQVLEVDRPIAVEIADLNADGRLDLLVGVYSDATQQEYDLGSFIYWGDAAGFKQSNAQWLPGLTVDDLTVADFDADGYLDVFSSNYHANGARESLPAYLFWGGPDGLDPDRKARLSVDSASGALAADFDGDGKLDVAVSCHARHGSHHTMSKIFYNDGRRFAHPRVAELPTAGSHWLDMHDMGHIRDRGWRQTYVSSAFKWDRSATRATIEVEAEVPEGCALTFEVRSAASEAELEAAPWRPVAGEVAELAAAHRAMQYRATFVSGNGDRYPILSRVRVNL